MSKKKVVFITLNKEELNTTGVGKYIFAHSEILKNITDVEFIFQPASHRPGEGFLWRFFKLPKILKNNYKDYIKIWSDENYLPFIRPWMKSSSILIIHHMPHFVPQKSLYEKIVGLVLKISFKFNFSGFKNIISISENTTQDILKITKTKINIIKIPNIFNLVPLQEKEPKKYKGENFKNKKILLSVSSLDNRKNFLILLELLKELSEDYVLVRIGGNGTGGGIMELERFLIENPELKKRYFNFSRLEQEEMAFFYRKSNILLISSLQEGFGRSVIEAQIYGLPVISTLSGGLKESVGEGSAFVIKDPFDITEYKKGIFEIENGKKEFFIKKGYENIKKFDAERYIDIWKDLLNNYK